MIRFWWPVRLPHIWTEPCSWPVPLSCFRGFFWFGGSQLSSRYDWGSIIETISGTRCFEAFWQALISSSCSVGAQLSQRSTPSFFIKVHGIKFCHGLPHVHQSLLYKLHLVVISVRKRNHSSESSTRLCGKTRVFTGIRVLTSKWDERSNRPKAKGRLVCLRPDWSV